MREFLKYSYTTENYKFNENLANASKSVSVADAS